MHFPFYTHMQFHPLGLAVDSKQIQMRAFKSRANSEPCNANIRALIQAHTLYHFTVREEPVCLFCLMNDIDLDTQITSSQENKGVSSCLYFFFLDRCLGLKSYTDSRCLSRFGACVQEQKAQHPVVPQHYVPQHGNCYSCGDLPFFATLLNPYFVSRNYWGTQRTTDDA